MFAIERYNKAQSVEDAVKLLVADPEAKLIAGGTDVLIRLHEGSSDFRSLVDINGLAVLKEISEEPDGTVRIGSLATFSEIMDSDVVNKRVPVIAEAAATVGGPQLRNTATMGGNICAGVPCADSAGALLVLEADLEIRGIDGKRVVPVMGFHLGPSRVTLKQGDVLVVFRIRPENYKGFGTAYYKYSMREAWTLPPSVAQPPPVWTATNLTNCGWPSAWPLRRRSAVKPPKKPPRASRFPKKP